MAHDVYPPKHPVETPGRKIPLSTKSLFALSRIRLTELIHKRNALNSKFLWQLLSKDVQRHLIRGT
jgi:hypothetical protein